MSAHRGRRGDVQGLRAVAVLLVVVYHSGTALSGGFVGVDVFFVISGFVITRMLLRELEQSGRIDLKRFYLRRVRRILPALAVLLGVVLVASVLLAPFGGQQTTARTGASAALFSANFYLLRFGGEGGYFDVAAETNALLHTWSLSVEEQFYFVFPALVLGAWLVAARRGNLRPRRSVLFVLVGVSIASFAVSLAFTNGNLGPLGSIDLFADLHREFAFYMPFTRAWEFGAGALLALVDPAKKFGPPLRLGLALFGVALIGWSSFAFDDLTAFPGTAAVVPVLGTVLLIAVGDTPGTNVVSALLSVRPMQWIGDLSYSWYLWHWPVIVFAAALWPATTGVRLIAAVLSLAPAWLSFRWVENPIRFRPQPRVSSTVRVAAVCIVLPLLAAGVLDGSHRTIDQNGAVAGFEEATQPHVDTLRECDTGQSFATRPAACAWPSEASTGQAVLIGDSNAGHFIEGFVAAANGLGLDAAIATQSACPFVDLVVIRDDVRNERCSSFVDQSIADLHPRLSPGVSHILIASASDIYIEEADFVLEDPVTGEKFETADEKAAAWANGLSRVIDRLEPADRSITVIHPIPKFRDWDPRNYAAGYWLFSTESVGRSSPLAATEQQRARAVAAESLAASSTNATAVDVASLLCSTDQCSTNVDGSWLWRDGSHISVKASLMLATVFEEVLGSS